MVVNLAAGLWGLAEATLFFVVPDVWLSLAGRRRLKTGLQACLWALAGALAGGALVYAWGVYDRPGALAVIEKVPAISPAMVARVATQLTDHGVLVIFMGPLTGTPYKLYAAQAADAHIGWIVFMLVSVPARGIRFVLVTAGVHFLFQRLVPARVRAHDTALILSAWGIFYGYYFVEMSG
ncbi:MAG: hypothetical protein QNJ01_00540 [Desulfobacterales bacterium]|nr:hypothetical protein [Desulfobacterales bacterium]